MMQNREPIWLPVRLSKGRLQKLCVSLNGSFNSLRLNSNVTLRDGGGAVLQEPLHKGNVVAVGLVDFRSVPLAKAVCADALKA